MNPITEETIVADIDRAMHTIDNGGEAASCPQVYETVDELFTNFQTRSNAFVENLEGLLRDAEGDRDERAGRVAVQLRNSLTDTRAEIMRLAAFLVTTLLGRFRDAIGRDYPRTDYCGIGILLLGRDNQEYPRAIRYALSEVRTPIQAGINDYIAGILERDEFVSREIFDIDSIDGTYHNIVELLEEFPTSAEQKLREFCTMVDRTVERATASVNRALEAIRRRRDPSGLLQAFFIRDLEHKKTSYKAMGDQYKCMLVEQAFDVLGRDNVHHKILSKLQATYGHMCRTDGQAFGRRRGHRGRRTNKGMHLYSNAFTYF